MLNLVSRKILTSNNQTLIKIFIKKILKSNNETNKMLECKLPSQLLAAYSTA